MAEGSVVLRRTSPDGDATSYGFAPAGGVAGGIFDFDVDGHDLKSRHREWLTREVVGRLRAGGSITLVGRTSRSGDPSYNEQLAHRRIDAVIRFLASPGAVGHQNFQIRRITAAGEAPAADAGLPDEDEAGFSEAEQARYRSVEISVWDRPVPPPPPPPPPPIIPGPPERPPGAVAFKIKMISGTISSSFVRVLHNFTFDVWDYFGDPRKRSIAVYRYRGSALVIPEKGINYFGTSHRWTSFQTGERIDVSRLGSERATFRAHSKGSFYTMDLRAYPSGRNWRFDTSIVPGPNSSAGGSNDWGPDSGRSPPGPLDIISGITNGNFDLMRTGRPSRSMSPGPASTTASVLGTAFDRMPPILGGRRFPGPIGRA